MATWNPPTDLELAVTKPVKASNHRRIRDLVTALAEGASGAPVVTNTATNSGFLRNITVDATAQTFELGEFDPNVDYEIVLYGLRLSNASQTVQLDFSDDNFSTTLSTVDISITGDYNAVNGFSANVKISSASGYGNYMSTNNNTSATAYNSVGSFVVPNGVTHIRVNPTATTTLLANNGGAQIWKLGEN